MIEGLSEADKKVSFPHKPLYTKAMIVEAATAAKPIFTTLIIPFTFDHLGPAGPRPMGGRPPGHPLRDVGDDRGTANPRVHVRGRGIGMGGPSVVAIDAKTKRVLAVGAEAKRMVGRTPANIIAVRPLRDGVISDFDVTEQMIKYFR